MATAKKTRINFGKKFITIEDSTLVDQVHYDPDTKTLDAVFKNGARYRYKTVPPVVFAKFVLAESMGKFFNVNIKGEYECKKVKAAPKAA